MIYLNRFLKEHPSFSVLQNLEKIDKEIVLWAKEHGYIRTEFAPGNVEVISKHQIEKAKMWWEKVGKNG